MLRVKVGHNLLSNIFFFFLPSYNVSLLSEIYFYLTLSKSERVSSQGIYNKGIKMHVNTKDIKKEGSIVFKEYF